MTADNEFPHEDELKASENEWVSNEPPVDDFNDPATEGATASEDPDQLHDDTMDAGEVQKKKFPLLLLLGTLGGLGAAGFAYWQFSNHNSDASALLDMAQKNTLEPSTPHFASSPEVPVETPAPAKTPNPAADVAPKTGFSPPGTMQASSPSQSQTEPSPASPAVTEKSAPSPSILADAAKNSNAGLGAQAPQPPMFPTQATAQNAAAVLSPQATAANAAAETRIASLQTRIDSLQKSLSDATQQIGELNAKLSSAPQASPNVASGQPDAATQERINKLEQKLLQMEQHQATPRSSSSQSTYVSQESEPHMASSAAPKHKHSFLRRHTAKPVHVASKSTWVLRAAAQDEAWVAKDESTREMRPVHVGDSLAGIGRVEAIRESDKGWVIEGTSGTIR